MRELRFDGLSPDGTRLVLAGKDGQKYTVAIDERLEAAVRRDRARMSQVEIEQSGMLRPREIQARIRSGATAEDVAAASGLPLEHVRRFEGPVLTERAWVAQQARATEVRQPGGDLELGELVADRLAEHGVDPADVAWDAWRRDDGLWVVIATFPVPPNTHVATWTYDSVSRTMTVADDNARALSAIGTGNALQLTAPRPLLASVADLEDEDDDDDVVTVLSGVPGRAEPAPEDDAELPVDEEPESLDSVDESDLDDSSDEASGEEIPADGEIPGQADLIEEVAAEVAEVAEVPQDQPPADQPAAPARPAPHRPGGKPVVPSFDDILFGPGPHSS